MSPFARSPADKMPADLADLNVAQPALFKAGLADAAFARLRREAPVHYCKSSAFGPYWSITKYRDIEEIELDTVTFSSAHRLGGIALPGEPDAPEFFPMFIAADPPEHTQQRRAVAPAFSGDQMKRLALLIRDRAAEILDALPIGETFDWVERVSVDLTAMTLATLLDFPQEERGRLVHWSNVMTAVPGGPIVASMEEKLRAMRECFEVFSEIRSRRERAAPALDLISMLVHGQATRSMSAEEFQGNIVLLIVGGNETTRSSISGSIVALNQFPEAYDKLRARPELLDGMVSEVMRWQSPAAHMRRTATRDVAFRGHTIRRGDKVVLWYASANRDEDVIEQADRFLIDRANPRRHLSFGHGVHRCVGARLAELQVRILWEEILRRFPTIELAGEPERSFSVFINGYDRMPVRIPRRLPTGHDR